MDEEDAKQKQLKERLMVAQTALAQNTIAKMQGVPAKGGMNARSAMRGRGQSMSVPRDGGNTRINLTELMKK